MPTSLPGRRVLINSVLLVSESAPCHLMQGVPYTILSLARFCLHCGKESHLEVRDRVFVEQGEWNGKQYEGETEADLLGCTECGQEFIPY